MSRAKPAAPVSAEITAEQPFLFDAKMLPLRQDLVVMVKEKSYLFTGKIVGKDAELCRAICQDLQLGLSGRKVAKKYRISRNSLLGIERVMRERGELEPLKKAILCQLDDIIYLGLERIREGIAEDEISPGQLPIPIAALIDKKGQLESGLVPGTDRTVAEVTAEQVRAAFDAMKRASVTVGTETESEGAAPLPLQISPAMKPDTAQDTSPARSQPSQPPAEGGGGVAPEHPPQRAEENG